MFENIIYNLIIQQVFKNNKLNAIYRDIEWIAFHVNDSNRSKMPNQSITKKLVFLASNDLGNFRDD